MGSELVGGEERGKERAFEEKLSKKRAGDPRDKMLDANVAVQVPKREKELFNHKLYGQTFFYYE